MYLFLEFGLDLIGKCIGEEAKYEGIRLLFDGLQQPVLNKQVTHNMTNLPFGTGFPEVNVWYSRGVGCYSELRVKSSSFALECP